MRNFLGWTASLFVFCTILTSTAAAEDDPETAPKPVRHVIHISVDGLRPDVLVTRSASEFPNFYRFREEGAFTDNARTDSDYSNTLPNHTSQLTGRSVTGPAGHNWTGNGDVDSDVTLHTKKGSYVASAFDVAHDHGLRTGLYASKSKFALFDNSYNESNGARDVTDADNGRDKIDQFVYDSDTDDLVGRFVRDMKATPYGYVFLHLRNPDTAGHWWGWDLGRGSMYARSVDDVDDLLGRIFELVDSTPRLKGNTVIILTSDHGGGGHWQDHGDATHPENYTVPFYVWGGSVEHQELYALNTTHRRHYGVNHAGFDADVQPIRNGDAANLALSHLGLPPVPGSSINVAQDLRTGPMPERTIEITSNEAKSTESGTGTLD